MVARSLGLLLSSSRQSCIRTARVVLCESAVKPAARLGRAKILASRSSPRVAAVLSSHAVGQLRSYHSYSRRAVGTSAAVAPRWGRVNSDVDEVPSYSTPQRTPQRSPSPQRSVPKLGSSANNRVRTGGWRLEDELASLEIVPEKKYKSDLVVVLDMDECLLHSVFQSASDDFEDFRQYEAERAERQQRKTVPSPEVPSVDSLYDDSLDRTVDTFQVTLPDGEKVLVHQRPHLNTFLAEVCKNFETHIFTAAMPVYAKPVLDILEQQVEGPLFSKRWYRDQCTVDRDLGVYVKDLQRVLTPTENKENCPLFNPKRTVLIDNNPMSFLANPRNGILVSNFYDDPLDETLPAVLELLRELDGLDDVRPKLHDLFGLSDALSQVVPKRLSGKNGNGQVSK